ncbi:MAG: hypothetical protein E3J78_06845 [Candidatus Cloacimonadota bacterium]|nr:MAG: hypothetical protein E3J78_06845 [Candidatus Cloacimonadota bacterium]
MYKKGLVRLMNVLIFFALLFLIYMIVYPNYKTIRRENKIADVKTNMYQIRAAVENYAAFNEGKYPRTHKEFKKYINNGSLPANPYTLVQMTDDEIIDNVYSDPIAFEDDNPDGVNSFLKADPGTIFYSVYASPGDSTFIIHYALVGMDEKGQSIIFIDPGLKKHIYILHE